MPNIVLTNGYVAFNSTALTGVKSINIDYKRENKDDTVMGANTKSNLPGLMDWTAKITFAQDLDATMIDSIVYTLFTASSTQARFLVDFRPTSAAVSTSNARYYGYGMITDYTPLNGNVGDFVDMPLSLVAAKQPGGSATSADLLRSTTST